MIQINWLKHTRNTSTNSAVQLDQSQTLRFLKLFLLKGVTKDRA